MVRGNYDYSSRWSPGRGSWWWILIDFPTCFNIVFWLHDTTSLCMSPIKVSLGFVVKDDSKVNCMYQYVCWNHHSLQHIEVITTIFLENFCTVQPPTCSFLMVEVSMARLQMIPRGASEWDHWESVHKQATNVSQINIIITSLIIIWIVWTCWNNQMSQTYV